MYRVTSAVGDGFVRFVLEGRHTLEDNKEVLSEIVRRCIEHGVHKALVDTRGLIGQPGLGAHYELAEFAANASRGKIWRIALFHRPDTVEYSSFLATASQNRGLTVRAFVDESQALEWLLSDDT